MAAYSRETGSKSGGPQLEDCQKLWDYLVTEFVTDLGLRVIFQAAKEPGYRACLQVWSPGLDPDTGKERDHIWATRDLQKGYSAITYSALYDLLIVAYRAIEGKLGGQEELPLL